MAFAADFTYLFWFGPKLLCVLAHLGCTRKPQYFQALQNMENATKDACSDDILPCEYTNYMLMTSVHGDNEYNG